MKNNHTPEMEAIRSLKNKVLKLDLQKFGTRVKNLENKEKPDWMIKLENEKQKD